MSTPSQPLPPPRPMATKGQPVDWMFAFKFNAKSFPGNPPDASESGMFGGQVQEYPRGHSRKYVFATSASPALVRGTGSLGASPTLEDPLAATFAQVYNTPGYFFVVWNDQFYDSPIATQFAPMGHSKGMVAWNADGEGFVLQVSTPSWPGSGSSQFPRDKNKVPDGNTLGCIHDDDIEVSQHFFAVTISKADLVAVLKSLANSSVVTDITQPSIVQNGGPPDVQNLVRSLGKVSTSTDVLVSTLSSGVKLVSKPSSLHVPVWQMVSAKLGGVNLLVASWWADPAIYSTSAGQIPGCWSPALGKPGAVEIAINGQWDGTDLGFLGGPEPDRNHAKVAVSVPKPDKVTKKLTGPKLCIFGDMNQQGAYNPEPPSGCDISQNARGGLFYVLENPSLWSSITKLMKGWTAPPVASSTSGKMPPTKKKSPAAQNAPVAKKTVKKAPKR